MTDIYKFQRSLRETRGAALNKGVIALLDLGTTKIGCLILRFEGQNAMVNLAGQSPLTGHGGFRIIGAATTRSRGIRFGEIETMSESESAVRTVIQAAQKMADTRVDHVIVAYAGGAPRSYGLAGQVDIMTPTVTGQDVAQSMASAQMPDIGEGRSVLHAQPVNFVLDGKSGLSDPRGQSGQTLATDLHLVTTEDDALQNLLYCVARCDLEVADVVSAPYAAGLSALVEDNQEMGAACIDFGGGGTGVSIFMKKRMIYTDCIKMGGDHVTSDISMGLQIPLPAAERLKTFYGGLVATGVDNRDMIGIGGDTGDWEHDRRQVSRSELIGIIRPRVEEILEGVAASLDGAGFEYMPNRQVVLTGGGSQLPGLDELCARMLGYPVRLGRPIRVPGLPQAATGPAFSTAVGLALHAANPQTEVWDYETPAEDLSARPILRALKWFRENW